MIILYRYLRTHWKLGAGALALAAINQIFSLLDPLIFRHIIDSYATRYSEYTSEQFLKGVSLLLGAAVAVAFVSRVAKNFQDYFVNLITQQVGAQIYSDGIRHSLELPYTLFEDQRSGETLGKLQKVRTDVEKFIATAVNLVFVTLIGLVFVVIYASQVHWSVAPAYLLTVPLLGGLSSVLSRKIKTVQKRIVQETTALAGATTESLRNIELVKSLGLAQQEIARLNSTTGKILKLELQKVRYLRSLSFVQGTCVNLLRTSILFLMLYLIFTQRISVGQFFSLFIYSFFIFGPLQELGNAINVYRETEVSLQNFETILNLPPEPRPESPVRLAALNTLRFDDVSFQHQSASAPALRAISFHASRGETVAFVGPSGSGKTTLVKLLVGLYRPKSGHIFYNGIAEDQVAIDDLRERIGFVTQDAQLFSGTIRENLRFVRPNATDEECQQVLKQASVQSLLQRADRGLDTLIGEGGVKVSGGEKQRLSIARALLRKPELLVFDEATSSLDSLTEEEISQTVRELAQNRDTITILIAHRLSTVMHADCIYVLERGVIAESGRHADLVAKKGLYYAMWRNKWEKAASEPLCVRYNGYSCSVAIAVWKGRISFGMVSVPVRLQKAARRERIKFHHVYRRPDPESLPDESDEARPDPEPITRYEAQIDASDGPAGPVERVHNTPVAEASDVPLPKESILKGFEIEKDQYVVLAPHEIAAMRAKTSSELEISEFVRMKEIDPIFFDTSYYVVPDKGGEKPYAVLFGAMKKTGYAGLGSLAMHGREHATVVRAGKRGLILHTLFYANEVRTQDEWQSTEPVSGKELELAGLLVRAMEAGFEPEKLKDSFEERLRGLIDSRSAAALGTGAVQDAKAPVIDIMDALRRSLESKRKPVKAAGLPGNTTKTRKRG